LGSVLLCTPVHAVESIAIIVNNDGPLTHLSKAEVREIYLGEIRFVESIRIIPIHSPEGPLKEIFLSTVIGWPSKSYKLHWTKKVFQEGLRLPPVKAHPEEIIEWVKEQPGAIGYVPRELADGQSGVRILYVLEMVNP
jgi:ABC-type phosphate transport system substrate-binding protein